MATPSAGSEHAALLSGSSDGTVAEEKPDLLVEQLLLQFDVGRSHKSLLALHDHLQHHPVQDRGLVLQLWRTGARHS